MTGAMTDGFGDGDRPLTTVISLLCRPTRSVVGGGQRAAGSAITTRSTAIRLTTMPSTAPADHRASGLLGRTSPARSRCCRRTADVPTTR